MMTLSGIFLIYKMQRLLNQRGKLLFNLLTASFRLFPLYTKIVIYTKKNPDGLQLTANHPGFQFEAHFSASLSYV